MADYNKILVYSVLGYAAYLLLDPDARMTREARKTSRTVGFKKRVAKYEARAQRKGHSTLRFP